MLVIRYRERDHRHGKTSAGMLRQTIRVSMPKRRMSQARMGTGLIATAP
jgi:hypothetical protein